jgi:hypothetical protein
MDARPVSEKSTNVRFDHRAAAGRPGDHRDPEATAGRAVTLALGAWLGLVALAAADGVFLRLGVAVDAALAAFATLFAAASYALDREVRQWVDEAPSAIVAAIALGGDAALAAALAFAGAPALSGGALALLAFFAAPVALAAHLPLARAWAGRRLRSAAGRSPGARPAAS